MFSLLAWFGAIGVSCWFIYTIKWLGLVFIVPLILARVYKTYSSNNKRSLLVLDTFIVGVCGAMILTFNMSGVFRILLLLFGFMRFQSEDGLTLEVLGSYIHVFDLFMIICALGSFYFMPYETQITLNILNNTVLSVTIVVLVFIQRGYEGAFARSAVHSIRTHTNTLWGKTLVLIVVFVANIICINGVLYHNIIKNAVLS